MKRRSIASIMILLISLCTAAGCGQSGSVENANKVNDEETTVVTATETAAETTADSAAEGKTEQVKEEAADNQNGPKTEFDKSAAENSLKEMSEALSGFLWASMMKESGYSYSPLEGRDIEILSSDEDIIRASVLACQGDSVIDSTFVLGMGGFSEDKNADDGIDGDGFHGTSVSVKDVEKKCSDLFGKKAPWDDLPIGPVCDLFDAVLYRNGNDSYPLIVERVVETETSLKNQECSVTEENGRYIGKVNMFWGYWGELEQKPGYSNYVATYTLEPNAESKYGMAITSISVSRSDDASVSSDAEDPADIDEVGDPYCGVLYWYKELQDSGKTWEEMEEYDSRTALVQHGWPYGTVNDEIRYVYQDITGDGLIELIITYFGEPVDIYSNDGDAVYSYGVPYRAIAEIYPDGKIMEGVTMGTKGWQKTWYRYNDKTYKYEPVKEELSPGSSPLTFGEGKKISDVAVPKGLSLLGDTEGSGGSDTNYEVLYEPVFDEIFEVIDYGYNMDSEYRYATGNLTDKIESGQKENLLSEIGYRLEDISGDGVPELLIGYDADYLHNGGESYISGIYTIKDGNPYTTYAGSYRSSYMRMDDSHFFYSGSLDSSFTVMGRNHLSSDGTEIVWDGCYFTEQKDDGSVGYYRNTSGVIDSTVSEEMNIADEDFVEIIDDYSYSCIKIGWTPIGSRR